MKKILIIFTLLIISIAVSAQTYALRGLIIGNPITGKALIDSSVISGDNLIFYSAGSSYLSPISTLFYFTKSTTDISPAISGDNILLPLTSYLKFGTGDDTYLYESSDNFFRVVVGGSLNWEMQTSMNISYTTVRPFSSGLYSGYPGYYWAGTYSNEYNIENSSTKISKDVSGNMLLTDINAGTKTLSQLVSPDSTWESIETNQITEKTSGSGVIVDGLQIVDHDLKYYSAGSIQSLFNFSYGYNTSVQTITPYNSSLDLGYVGTPWGKIYGLASYIGAGGTNYISKDGSNNMSFTDAVTGTITLAALASVVDSSFVSMSADTIYLDSLGSGMKLYTNGAGVLLFEDDSTGVKTLAQLAASSGSGVTSGLQDTINELYQQVFVDTADLETLARMKYDTIPLVPWVKGEGLTGDSATFNVGASMIIKWESSAGDTLVVDNFMGNVDATAKSATIKVEIDDTYAFTSPTTIMVATAITGASAATTGQEVTTFTSQDIPPGYYIKMSITALSTDKPNQFLGQLNGHMKN